MRDEPAEISCDLVTEILSEHWGFRAAEVAYAPVGFGSHHWIASEADGPRWFVTADRLDPRGNWLGSTAEQVKGSIEAAAHTTKELAESGYEFVVAPLPDRTGGLVREVLPGWILVVLPYLQGWSTPGGAWDDPAERAQIAGILGRLHAATPPKPLQRWEFAVPGREALLATLADLDRPWSSGPYSEPTRLRLAGAIDHLRDRLRHYDALVREIEASDDPWVVTHGEPHSANVLRTTDGRMRLIDWDTVQLARPVRGPRRTDRHPAGVPSGDRSGQPTHRSHRAVPRLVVAGRDLHVRPAVPTAARRFPGQQGVLAEPDDVRARLTHGLPLHASPPIVRPGSGQAEGMPDFFSVGG